MPGSKTPLVHRKGQAVFYFRKISGGIIMPVIDMKATGLKIKELIKAKGMTVKDVQNIFGFASPYPVYKWMNGKSLPALDNLVVLAKVMNVKMDDLIVTEKV
jgi:hypothetical protein